LKSYNLQSHTNNSVIKNLLKSLAQHLLNLIG